MHFYGWTGQSECSNPRQCTLRAAVQQANARPGHDTIFLPSGNYRFSIAGAGEDAAATGDLDIIGDLRILLDGGSDGGSDEMVKVTARLNHRGQDGGSDGDGDDEPEGGSDGGPDDALRRRFALAAVQQIHVVACGGDDDVNISRRIRIPARVEGGAGRDKLRSGAGDDIVDGGEGDDRIWTRGGNDTITDLSGHNHIWSGEGDDQVTTGDGHDQIHTDGGDDVIFTGAGNNQVRAGSGSDIVVGGPGNDQLDGGAGRDLLIGGAGEVDLTGAGDDDLLIAGFTSYDNSLAALQLIMAEWSSARTYLERVENLRQGTGPVLTGTGVKLAGSGPERTVFDDGASDKLRGESGRDWFFALLDDSEVEDDVKGRKRDELLDEIFAGP